MFNLMPHKLLILNRYLEEYHLITKHMDHSYIYYITSYKS